MTATSPIDIAHHLYAEFHNRFSLGQIVAVVRTAEHDLAGTPRDALPELAERLTRQRLIDQLEAPRGQPV